MVRAFTLFLLLAFPSFAFAQAMPSLGAGGVDPLTVTVTPRYPRPYDTVEIKPQTTLLNLAGSTIVVTVDGKEVGRGSGNQAYKVVVGGPGSSTRARVTVTGPDGINTEDVVLRPSDVTLVLDPISTTHPFYQGGNLVAPQGRVRIIALADLRKDPATRIPDSGLVYTWKSGIRLLQPESGLGKSTLSASAPTLFRDTTVSVTVSTPDGSVAGEASIVVSPIEPSLLVYKDNPLTGPDFAHALSGTYQIQDTEEAFRAVPYFFSSMPSLVWQLGNAFAGSESAITVRTTGDKSGVANLSVSSKQEGSYYEPVQKLLIRYGEDTRGTGFFGI